jgi:hypothetical protein
VIIETGTIVFLSLMVLVWRLPRRAMLWLFGHPLWIEVPFSFCAYALHYGTFSGMMAAATVACMCFCFVQAGRALFGYIAKGTYRPGYITLSL